MSSTVANGRRSKKSDGAFRTISEVAKELDLQQHVLRFWETRFDAVQPLKRGGGRRYYRPEDVQLLRTIRDRLYQDGFTIKGVQRLLDEKGVDAFVAEAGHPIENLPTAAETNEPHLPFDQPSDEQAADLSCTLSENQRKEIQSAIHELEALKLTLDQALENA